MSSQHLNLGVFSKYMEDVDKDFRQMALYELKQAAEQYGQAFTEIEQKVIVPSLMRCFQPSETSEEVRNDAVRVTSKVFDKVDLKQREFIVSSLFKIIRTETADKYEEQKFAPLREHAALSLKHIIDRMVLLGKADIGILQTMTPSAQRVFEDGIQVAKHPKNATLKVMIYDMFAELLTTYQPTHEDLYIELSSLMMEQLKQSKEVRQQAIVCLAHLCVHARAKVLSNIIAFVRGGLENSASNESTLNTFMEVLQALIRTAPRIIFQVAVDAIPAILARISDVESRYAQEDEIPPTALELINDALHVLEAFWAAGYSPIPDQLEVDMVKVAVKLAKFDPNNTGADVCYEDDGYDDGDYNYIADDIDDTWKTRMLASRSLAAVLTATRTPQKLASTVFETGRFLDVLKDREEHVVLEALAFIRAVTTPQQVDSYAHPSDNASRSRDIAAIVVSCGGIPALLAVASSKQAKASAAAVSVLHVLFKVAPSDALVPHLPAVCEGIVDLLDLPTKQQNFQIKLDAIALAKTVLALVANLSTPLSGGTSGIENVAASILRACEEPISRLTVVFVSAIPPLAAVIAAVLGVPGSGSENRGAALAVKCLTVLNSIVTTQGTGAEREMAVKEALQGISVCIHSFAAIIPVDMLKASQAVLIGALTGETLLEATKAICGCEETFTDVSAIQQITERLVDAIPKTLDHQLKESILWTLIVLIDKSVTIASQPLVAALCALVVSSSKYLNASEVSTANMTLQFLAVVASRYPNVEEVVSQVEPRVLEFLCTQAHKELVEVAAFKFYRALVLSHPSYRSACIASCIDRLNRQAISVAPTISVAISAVASAYQSEVPAIIEKVKSGVANLPQKLTCFGEIGLHCSIPQEQQTVLLEHIDSTDKDRPAAIAAAGRAAANITNTDIMSALLLQVATAKRGPFTSAIGALREAASTSLSLSPIYTDTNFSMCDAACRDKIVAVLQDAAADEGNVEDIAASIGAIACLNPSAVLPRLSATAEQATAESNLRAVACIAVRHVVTTLKNAGTQTTESARAAATQTVQALLPTLLNYLNRQASVVQRCAAISLFATITQHLPAQLFTENVKNHVFPHILEELETDPVLLKLINLGTYTHRVDKGLALRQQAYECIVCILNHDERFTHSQLLRFWGQNEKLAVLLISGCGPQCNGEVDESIQLIAKVCLARLMTVYPDTEVSETHVNNLALKLKPPIVALFEEGAEKLLDAGNVTNSKRSVFCILHVSQKKCFIENQGIQEVAGLARLSPVLSAAMKLL